MYAGPATIRCPRCKQEMLAAGLWARSSFIPHRGIAVCRHCGARVQFTPTGFRLFMGGVAGMVLAAVGLGITSIRIFEYIQTAAFYAFAAVMALAMLALAGAFFTGIEETH